MLTGRKLCCRIFLTAYRLASHPIRISMWDLKIPTSPGSDHFFFHWNQIIYGGLFFIPFLSSPHKQMLTLQRFPGSTLEPSCEPIILFSDHVKSTYQGPLRGVVTSPLRRSHKPPPIRIPEHNPSLMYHSEMREDDFSAWSGRTTGEEHRPFFLLQPLSSRSTNTSASSLS